MHRRFRFLALISCAGLALACKSSTSDDGAAKSDSGAASAASVAAVSVNSPWAPKERTFTVTYGVTVPEVPAGAKELRVWLPQPRQDAPVQEVLSAGLAAPTGAEVTEQKDASGENRVWSVLIKNPVAPIAFDATLTVRRREQVNNNFRGVGRRELSSAEKTAFAAWLRADALVPITGEPAEIAAGVASTEKNSLNVARALYDTVLSRMKYDKSGTGWGRGDTLWACKSGYGNCTDFHSMFMSFTRSRGIPSRFFMGLPLPVARGEGEIKGYHCWAEFYAPEIGWVPVDISEAAKAPELAQYYFGALTEDRVSFTLGRDLKLSPEPKSGPRNFLIYPLAEADGQEIPAKQAFKFKDA